MYFGPFLIDLQKGLGRISQEVEFGELYINIMCP